MDFVSRDDLTLFADWLDQQGYTGRFDLTDPNNEDDLGLLNELFSEYRRRN